MLILFFKVFFYLRDRYRVIFGVFYGEEDIFGLCFRSVYSLMGKVDFK